MRVYIAGPYAGGDSVLNVRSAVEAAEKIQAAGHVPFVPHLTHLWHLISPHEPGFWYKYDLAWLEVCDCLVRLPGKSPGADEEVRLCKLWGIPVYKLDDWLEAQ